MSDQCAHSTHSHIQQQAQRPSAAPLSYSSVIIFPPLSCCHRRTLRRTLRTLRLYSFGGLQCASLHLSMARESRGGSICSSPRRDRIWRGSPLQACRTQNLAWCRDASVLVNVPLSPQCRHERHVLPGRMNCSNLPVSPGLSKALNAMVLLVA